MGSAKLTLDYCKIKRRFPVLSPTHGQARRPAATSTKVYSIVNPDLLLAKIHLTEKSAPHQSRTTRGDSSEALPEHKFAGEVDRVSPVVDPSSGMVRVTIRVADRQRLLKPGMFVNVI
jgi:multidrug efflux pump subunit AcrA (membrane-fusion protein)